MSKVAPTDSPSVPDRPALTRIQHANFRGPIKNRSCTDLVCLGVFFAFLAGWAYIAHFAFSNGLLARITHPVDSNGQICGLDNARTRPFLFYFDLTKCASPTVLIVGCLTPTVCVQHCPNTTFEYFQFLENPFQIDPSPLICVDFFNKSTLTHFGAVSEAVLLGQCAAYYLPSGPVAGRCMPGFIEGPGGQTETLFDDLPTNLSKSLNGNITFNDILDGSTWITILVQTQQVFMNIGSDFQASWKIILIWFLFSALLSLLWITLIRWTAGVMVWASLAAILGGLAYGIYFSYTKYVTLSNFNHSNSSNPSLITSMQQMNSTLRNMTFNYQKAQSIHNRQRDPTYWLGACIACCFSIVILILIIIFLRTRIRVALAIIRASSRAIGQMKSTLLFPIFPLLLQFITLAICGACSLWLFATGNPEGIIDNSVNNVTIGLRTNDSCNPNTFVTNHPNATGTCRFIRYAQDPLLNFYQFVNLFGFFWGIAFAQGLSQTVLAGAFASYYWAFKKPDQVPIFPLLASFYRTIRYHLGSIAFGSLLVAMVQIAQAVLKYLQKKLKHGNNCYTRFVIKVCTCCFYCLEKCIKFLNKYAYIMIAIFGKNFCASAKDAFFLLARNVLRVVVVDGVVMFFMLLGKLIIMGILGYSAYAFFNGNIPNLTAVVPRLCYFEVPMVTIILGSYVISSVFFSVYKMAIDTIFLCFLEDLERNDGSVEKPFFMSKSLMEIYGNKNTFETSSTLPRTA